MIHFAAHRINLRLSIKYKLIMNLIKIKTMGYLSSFWYWLKVRNQVVMFRYKRLGLRCACGHSVCRRFHVLIFISIHLAKNFKQMIWGSWQAQVAGIWAQLLIIQTITRPIRPNSRSYQQLNSIHKPQQPAHRYNQSLRARSISEKSREDQRAPTSEQAVQTSRAADRTTKYPKTSAENCPNYQL